jgi:hypothetical protein
MWYIRQQHSEKKYKPHGLLIAAEDELNPRWVADLVSARAFFKKADAEHHKQFVYSRAPLEIICINEDIKHE